jgi:large subunit ribosomal protein L6
MSRIAKLPVTVPSDVEVNVNGNRIAIKGSKGSLEREVHKSVELKLEDNTVKFSMLEVDAKNWAQAGTERALINNMVIGVSQGYEKKLELVGVGYRAQMKGAVLNLALGYSHDINFTAPEGIQIATPSQTEVVIRGIDKQVVGQVAAQIRSYRSPEPYKGKGVRYSDEKVRRKEVKKS